MILLEMSLAVFLIWTLTSISLVLGGVIGMCAMRGSRELVSPRELVLWTRRPQKSDLYID